MTIRLTPAQLGVVAEKLMDLGNIVAGALLFGQVVSEKPFDMLVALLGLLLLGLAYMRAVILLRGGGQHAL